MKAAVLGISRFLYLRAQGGAMFRETELGVQRGSMFA